MAVERNHQIITKSNGRIRKIQTVRGVTAPVSLSNIAFILSGEDKTIGSEFE